MAVYDPPDGSTDSRPRCTGHCCRGFSLEHPKAAVEEEVRRIRAGEPLLLNIPQVETIAEMIIPLGVFRGQELFTCKHLSKEGNCTIYETRPPMCRNFPGPEPCPYRNCASHGEQPIWKKAWNWVRE